MRLLLVIPSRVSANTFRKVRIAPATASAQQEEGGILTGINESGEVK